ncbi:MAG: hypothetical protein Q9165_008004 [Trypethelium subeluteriae]
MLNSIPISTNFSTPTARISIALTPKLTFGLSTIDGTVQVETGAFFDLPKLTLDIDPVTNPDVNCNSLSQLNSTFKHGAPLSPAFGKAIKIVPKAEVDFGLFGQAEALSYDLDDTSSTVTSATTMLSTACLLWDQQHSRLADATSVVAASSSASVASASSASASSTSARAASASASAKGQGYSLGLTKKHLTVLLDYGADLNGADPDGGPSFIKLTVIPQSLATPRKVLQLLLQKGAALDDGLNYDGSSFSWAIGSSNVLAVLDLLLHGAVVSDPALRNAEGEIRENEQILSSEQVLPVLDEDGQECDQGWENMMAAATLTQSLLHTAHSRPKCKAMQSYNTYQSDETPESHCMLEQKLMDVFRRGSDSCKGKMSIRNLNPPTYLLEVHIRDEA